VGVFAATVEVVSAVVVERAVARWDRVDSDSSKAHSDRNDHGVEELHVG
jgi:hypothetical protein